LKTHFDQEALQKRFEDEAVLEGAIEFPQVTEDVSIVGINGVHARSIGVVRRGLQGKPPHAEWTLKPLLTNRALGVRDHLPRLGMDCDVAICGIPAARSARKRTFCAQCSQNMPTARSVRPFA
jgi:hypothetical protein